MKICTLIKKEKLIKLYQKRNLAKWNAKFTEPRTKEDFLKLSEGQVEDLIDSGVLSHIIEECRNSLTEMRGSDEPLSAYEWGRDSAFIDSLEELDRLKQIK